MLDDGASARMKFRQGEEISTHVKNTLSVPEAMKLMVIDVSACFILLLYLVFRERALLLQKCVYGNGGFG